jgi:hypothetical protein
MWFLIHNTNAPDAAARKPAHARAHQDYLREAQDRMVTAGPYYDADGETRIGSVFIVDFPDIGAAQGWIDAEPYTKQGIYARHAIHRYDHLWPKPTGGDES